jgi:hypothetical protein
LHGVLGGGEMPEAPDQRAENLRRQLAQQVLDLGVKPGSDQISSESWFSSSGRTSATLPAKMSPGLGQFASRAAISVARSKLSHSTIQ